jgi:Putative zinc-finger
MLKNCPVVQLFGRANAPLQDVDEVDRGDVQIRGTMSCKDTIHLICWYLERKLSPSVESEIERHLSECHDCHLVFEAANTTLDRYFGPTRASESETARTAA